MNKDNNKREFCVGFFVTLAVFGVIAAALVIILNF